MKCNGCLWRHECHTEALDDEKESGTLWHFPYQQYADVNEMHAALEQHHQQWVSRHHVNGKDAYWNRHNTEGYTFTQWTIYYVSKKNHAYRRIRPTIEILFHALSRMPFFGRLLGLGRRDDRHHHTLHHFLFWMESGMTFFQKRLYRDLVHWLNRHRLSYLLFVSDQNNRSVIDYFHQVQLPSHIFQECRSLTRAYKETERAWFAQLDFLARCEECNDWVRPYEDLVEHTDDVNAWLDEHPDWSDTLLEMIQKREKCNRMYLQAGDPSRPTDEQSVQRHDYVLDVYRTLFVWDDN